MVRVKILKMIKKEWKTPVWVRKKDDLNEYYNFLHKLLLHQLVCKV